MSLLHVSKCYQCHLVTEWQDYTNLILSQYTPKWKLHFPLYWHFLHSKINKAVWMWLQQEPHHYYLYYVSTITKECNLPFEKLNHSVSKDLYQKTDIIPLEQQVYKYFTGKYWDRKQFTLWNFVRDIYWCGTFITAIQQFKTIKFWSIYIAGFPATQWKKCVSFLLTWKTQGFYNKWEISRETQGIWKGRKVLLHCYAIVGGVLLKI